jgi:16S rRNA (uracil1498-N3)-methyltransferase
MTHSNTEPWFYLPQLIGRETIHLTGEEARHIAGARRYRVGDTVTFFDGVGHTLLARLERLDTRPTKITLSVTPFQTHEQPSPQISLACALPKGDRVSVLLDMSTQLGMHRFIPLQCAHSKPIANNNNNRWQRLCIEACKQSRRAYLPILESTMTPLQACRSATSLGDVIVVAHPNGTANLPTMVKSARNATLFIGPEGGFTDDELQYMEDSGGVRVTLGAAVLRIETAATALLSQWCLKV